MKSFEQYKQERYAKETAANGGLPVIQMHVTYWRDYENYLERLRIARICKCGDCVCCRTAKGEIS